MLAVVEMVFGVAGLLGAIGLLISHNAGMVLILWPLLAAIALLLVAGAAIFVRRPWSYYLHMVMVFLVGLLAILYMGAWVGADGWGALLAPVGIVVVPLTACFLLPPVRRYFGVRQ